MISPKEGVSFREMITGNRFYYGAELVTTRGFAPADQPNKNLQLAQALCSDPRIGWVSLTDNPGGNVMLPPDWLTENLGANKSQVVIHLTCKDRNRNALEAAAWKYASDGFENLVAMTGDYPRSGFGGTAAPVFDLDSVGLVALLRAMNDGLPVPGRRGETTVLPKTSFFIGCCVSPFKRYERELMPQYFKLLRKIACGAQFVYTQLGYDMRKSHEVKLLLASHQINVPVIGNVYLLNRTVAEMFHRRDIPGCVVSDKLLELAQKYAAGPDKGRSFFQELAAKQLAVFKGLGFNGGYIGGIAKAETFFELIDKAESYGENDWREFAKEIQFPQPDEFYLFERDPQTGLGNPNQLNQSYLRSLAQPPKSKHVTLNYRLSRMVHHMFFEPGTRGFNLMKRFYLRLDKKPGLLSRGAHAVEHLSKFVLYGCQDCGDCSLPDCGYMCPLASCSKTGRNGPCGGSVGGRCELDDKECIWARTYERLKHFKEVEGMLSGPAVFYNAQLRGTSGWANFYLDRNHHAKVAQASSLRTNDPSQAGSLRSNDPSQAGGLRHVPPAPEKENTNEGK
ncbi:MAG: methylenetetrahydrofolate reductase [Verrucomicrobia bacterium]|nr:methylenetetrahydrofolate reductase [Verrucomicrobiota bacterium]